MGVNGGVFCKFFEAAAVLGPYISIESILLFVYSLTTSACVRCEGPLAHVQGPART
jgi:hypothetical protein